ncbi:serine hydrolase [Rugosimonospora africana]|uniref:Carrier domain-containing protein n=1 Tax=Rugosimonospora africana TaxID=556532 RepID=A0A8J3VVC0_9ACTN|nr:serine hydrolase [Rugosimonospora africana]GIH19631.1 hypothetical protein Raf01_78030 [Rugosimonospora africana]
MAGASDASGDDQLEVVRGVWRAVLNVDDVDTSTHFFRAGGTSIKGAMLLSRIRKATGVRIPVQDFLRDPTPGAIAALLTGAPQPTTAGPVSAAGGDLSADVAGMLSDAVASGRILGAQVHAIRGSQVVLDLAAGAANDQTAMTTGSTFRWFCAGKPLTALACATLVDAGALEWTQRLADHFPELRAAPVGEVTVAQLLNSTSGIVETEPLAATAEGLAALSMSGPAGTVAYYSYYSGWQVLRTLVERVTRGDFMTYFQKAVSQPLGLDATTCDPVGTAAADGHRVSQGSLEPNGWMPVSDALITPKSVGQFDVGRGFCGPARDLAAVFAEIRDGLAGAGKVLTRRIAQTLVSMSRGRVRDANTEQFLDIGLGLQLNMADVLATEKCSPASFGHIGTVRKPIAVGLYEPTRDVVVAILLRGDSPNNQILLTELIDRILVGAVST